MRKDCEICGGRGFIRLPLRGPMSAVATFGGEGVRESARSYVCPECIGQADLARVRVASAIAFAPYAPELAAALDAMKLEGAALGAMKLEAARKIGEFLLQEGCLIFCRADAPPGEVGLRAMVGVAPPAYVVVIEDRIAAKQDEVAHEVVRRAVDSIGEWAPS